MARMAVDIRSVLIPLTGKRLLLPNATVAEVITYSTPEPVEDTPDWLLGRVVWRGWWVPVFSLPMLGGWAARENEAGAKIAVMKALGGNPDMPFLAMVTQGFPRLVTVTADSLRVVDGEAPDEARDGSADAGADADADPAAEQVDAPEEDIDLADFSVELEGSVMTPESGEGPENGPEVLQDMDAESDADPVAPADGEGAEPAEPAGTRQPGDDDGFDPTAAVVEVSGERAIIPDLVPIERRVARVMGRDVLRQRR